MSFELFNVPSRMVTYPCFLAFTHCSQFTSTVQTAALHSLTIHTSKNIEHSLQGTHCVASNITMSSGSPVSSPPVKVSEWQLATAAIQSDSTGRRDGSCNGSANNFES